MCPFIHTFWPFLQNMHSASFATHDPTSDITGHDTEFPAKCTQRTIEKKVYKINNDHPEIH